MIVDYRFGPYIHDLRVELSRKAPLGFGCENN